MKENIVPVKFDPVFKAVFGNNKYINILENLICIYFKIPLDNIKGHVVIINGEKRLKNKKDKKQSVDIIAKFIRVNENLCLNLEMNNKLSESIIDRNINYLSGIFYQGLKNKEDYQNIPTTIQLNFNLNDIDLNNTNIIDKYYLQNENGYCLTKKFQSHHVNIAKCYKIWYNQDVSKYDEYEQQIILLGALMYTTKKGEFITCLEDINMDNETKKDVLDIMDDMNSDDYISMYYDQEEHEEKLKRALIYDAKQEGKRIGYTEGEKNKQLEIAKKMLEQKIEINTIMLCTGLTKEELENLK